MGNGIQINRVADRFSSHTLSHSRPRNYGTAGDAKALRETLIAATAAVVAEGGDPRLVKSLALL